MSLAPLILALACSSAGPDDLRDATLSWSAEPIWARGGTTDTAFQLSVLHPYQVAVISPDSIAVLDFRAASISVLDSLGHNAGQLLARGSGPGELERPFGIYAGPSGVLWALDPIGQRLVSWSVVAGTIGEQRLGEPLADAHFALENNALLRVVEGRSMDSVRSYLLIQSAGASVDTLAVMPRPEYGTGDFPSCGARQISGYPILSPTLRWTSSGGKLAFVTGTDYRIQVRRADGTQSTLTRTLPVTPADSAVAASYATGRVMNGCRVPPGEVVHAFGFAPEVPLIERLELSPDGSLFVQRRTVERGSVIDVFGPDESYLGTLSSEFPMPVSFVSSTRFLGIHTDSNDVPVLTAYELRK